VRVVVVVVLALLLAGVVAAWVRGYVALDSINYNWGTLRAPGEDAHIKDRWTYRSHSLGVINQRGQVTLAILGYLSMGETQADMAGWIDRESWSHASVPISMMSNKGLERWWSVRAWDDWVVLGAGLQKTQTRGETARAVVLPHWLLALGVAGLLVRAARGGKRTRRRRRGLCPACGYDVKGAFEGGCPECGWNRAPLRGGEG
jgi:hypothetical protein